MSNENHQAISSKNGVIYFSNSKDSLPYKTYIHMQQEFWRHQLNLSKKNSMFSNNLSNDTRNKGSTKYDTSSLEISSGIDSRSDSSGTLKLKKLKPPSRDSVNHLNTSENNDDTNEDFNSKLMTTSHAFPLSVDMSTQFNSDMKIIIEQDVKDKNVVNIRFGGTFTGAMTGSGTIPHDTLRSILNETIKDQKTDERRAPMIINQTKETIKETKTNSMLSKTKNSSGSEESVSYFATTNPVEPNVIKASDRSGERLPKGPEILSTNLRTDATVNSVSKFGSTTVSKAQYNEPFTDGQNAPSIMPSLSNYSANKSLSTVPAVLPTCIVRRTERSMVADLELPKTVVKNPFKLELKIKSLTNSLDILDLNWHLAIKRGKIMIGELIELILSVNVDGSGKTLNEVQQILLDLKNEFIGCCVYLAKPMNDMQIKDKICLELMIDLMSDEIEKLLGLYGDWKKTSMKTDFSEYYKKYFKNTISPDISDDKSMEATTTTTTTTTTYETKSVINEVKRVSLIKKSDRLTQGSSASSEDTVNDRIIEKVPEIKNAVDNKRSYNDPSIITNSRVKKSMDAIYQSALEQNLTHPSISKESRKQLLPLEVQDEHPILKRNEDVSIIKVLNNQTQLWQMPVNAGKNTIRDLIEFIINTIAQDKETSKELFGEIINELNHLENELILSVAKNLHDCRVSDDDLNGLCYEILAEIIYDEMAIARYMFNSLDVKGIDNTMLGRLFRNYTNENQGIRQNFKPLPPSENYAHLTSEVMNYSEGSKLKLKKGPTSMSELDLDSVNQRSVPKIKSDLESIKRGFSQTSMSEDIKSNQEKSKKFPIITGKQNRSNQDDISYSGGNNQLLLIINKLNNQTNEINKIKETLQVLSGCVEEKLSSWTCNYINKKGDKSNSEIPDDKNKFHYSKTTNLYNTQEVVEPPVDLMKNIQPSEHLSLSETGLNAKKIENKSYIAPISSQTIEQKVKTPQSSKNSFNYDEVDYDLLQLIADGAHNFLESKQISTKIPNRLQRTDSCATFNTEFDKIFEWICDKYQESLSLMMANSASRTIVEALNTAPLEEKRKIEKELISRIIEQNNFSINSWVRDICFQKVLNCLS